MIPIEQSQAIWKYKWEKVILWERLFYEKNLSCEKKLSESRPNFRISTKFQNLNQISESYSSYRHDTLGPFCLWQCFPYHHQPHTSLRCMRAHFNNRVSQKETYLFTRMQCELFLLCKFFGTFSNSQLWCQSSIYTQSSFRLALRQPAFKLVLCMWLWRSLQTDKQTDRQTDRQTDSLHSS